MQYLNRLKQPHELAVLQGGIFGFGKTYQKPFMSKLLDSTNPYLLYKDNENKLDNFAKAGVGYGFDRVQRVTNMLFLLLSAAAIFLAFCSLAILPLMQSLSVSFSASTAASLKVGIEAAVTTAVICATPGALKLVSQFGTKPHIDVKNLTNDLSQYISQEVEKLVDAIKYRVERSMSSGREMELFLANLATTIQEKYEAQLGYNRTNALIEQLQSEAETKYRNRLNDGAVAPVEISNFKEMKTAHEHAQAATKVAQDALMDITEAKILVQKMNNVLSESNLFSAILDTSGEIKICVLRERQGDEFELSPEDLHADQVRSVVDMVEERGANRSFDGVGL